MASGGGSGNASQKIDHVFKLVLAGDAAVGKSQILARFAKNEFSWDSRATIGVEFQNRTLIIANKSFKAQIWDTTGQERYRAVASAYYRGAVGVMLVYDIKKRQTFDHIPRWLEEVRKYVDNNTVVILIGNKIDMEDQRAVPTKEAKEYAQKEGLFFQEVSARKSTNVDNMFFTVFSEIVKIINNERMVAGDEHDGNTGCVAGKKIIVPPPVQDHKKEDNQRDIEKSQIQILHEHVVFLCAEVKEKEKWVNETKKKIEEAENWIRGSNAEISRLVVEQIRLANVVGVRGDFVNREEAM